MFALRLICLAYWSLLTVLLLVPDPWALLRIARIPSVSGGAGVHFVCFAVLSVLTLASRFPVQRVWLACLLIGYATASELLQSCVRVRTVEFRDFAEDVLGLAAGAAAWWAAQKYLWRRKRNAR